MKFGRLSALLIICLFAAIPAVHASSLTATSATCNSVDGAVGTFTCGAGAAQVGAVPAINGFGFFISPTFEQFTTSPNGAAPLGTIVDGSHDPASTPVDGTSGCTSGVTVNQHCETLTFTTTATATSIAAGSTLGFNWNNINLTLADFGGPNGSYIDQYFVTYIIKQGATTVVDWVSAPVNFTKTGSGTGSGPTTELNLSGSGTTTLGTTLNGPETVEAIVTVGWVWLGPQTGTPAAAGSQGPGVDLDIKIGQGSLDIGVVPEPSTVWLAGLGLALVGIGFRRKVSVQ
jgi:PEP-CTERM motif